MRERRRERRLETEEAHLAAARAKMVERQLRGHGIHDERVLAAMAEIPRERFVVPELAALAYDDRPLPIVPGATISQPYMVALMTQALALEPSDRVLEIGSGSGYQTAILACLAASVCALELDGKLVHEAEARLATLSLGTRVDMRAGDGRRGWPERGLFDAIVVAACLDVFPQALFEQLTEGGRLVYPQAIDPQGDEDQRLLLTEKRQAQPRTRLLGLCRFVPLL